ncbi:MAG TPA: pantoate--beta-alanine ligase [Mycobacteriales bacterium]|nr:pantoate--beta-alanine ligase [Mycobacteriales bacterium]
MNVVQTREELAAARAELGSRVGLVPTMGALHAGHRTLVERAVAENDDVTVSIFVNPMQFGPNEDLDRYPRTMDADLAMCEAAGVELVFTPTPAVVYPNGTAEVTVDPGPLGTVLEGRSRPTHFRGVLTVVAKLFSLVRPDQAYFGEKDYQQLALIRRMVRDLDLGYSGHPGPRARGTAGTLGVVGCPTVREPDGLAMSSRNIYLSAADWQRALGLSQALRDGAEAGAKGADAVLDAARAQLSDVDVDYLELRDPDLGPAPERGAARLLVAARVGPTRLIDNAPVSLGDPLSLGYQVPLGDPVPPRDPASQGDD